MKKKMIISIVMLIICCIVFWGISIAKCEILTALHGNEFTELYKENSMIGNQKYLKVLNYSASHARIYYVGENNSSANILTFVNKDKKWEYENWECCVWSKTGSASEVVWPYWWHFIYGGI